MFADIFYPIFTLMITILVCFIQKKINIVWGFHTHFFIKASPWPSGGLTSPPRSPAAIVFGFAKSRCPHIFSILSHGSALATQHSYADVSR